MLTEKRCLGGSKSQAELDHNSTFSGLDGNPEALVGLEHRRQLDTVLSHVRELLVRQKGLEQLRGLSGRTVTREQRFISSCLAFV